MNRHTRILIAALVGAGAVVTVLADPPAGIRYDQPKSTFERAMEDAASGARDNTPGADKATRDGEAAREAAGVSHAGQVGRGGLGPKEGPSIGGSLSAGDGGKIEGHIRIDTDAKAKDRPAADPAPASAPAPAPAPAPAEPKERSDRTPGDRPSGGRREGGFMHDGFHSDLSDIA